jgi:AP-2 complex subunit alpha
VTLLMTENSDLVRMVINSMRTDLVSTNDVYVNLSLAAIANIGGKEMAESLHQDVHKLLVSSVTKPSVKKRAALCLLRLFRKSPESLPAADWADKIVSLLEDADLVRMRARTGTYAWVGRCTRSRHG